MNKIIRFFKKWYLVFGGAEFEIRKLREQEDAGIITSEERRAKLLELLDLIQ